MEIKRRPNVLPMRRSNHALQNAITGFNQQNDRGIRSHLDEDGRCRKLKKVLQQYQCVKSTHSASETRR